MAFSDIVRNRGVSVARNKGPLSLPLRRKLLHLQRLNTMLPHMLGTGKVPQRNSVTKILPNVRVNFLVRFASNPLFYWMNAGNPFELFRNVFGVVRANFWFCGSFLAPQIDRHFNFAGIKHAKVKVM